MKRILFILTFGLLLFASPVSHVSAQQSNELQLSPSRQSITAKAGNTKYAKVEVTNHTQTPITIAFHVEQFSVDGKTRVTTFDSPRYDWVSPEKNQVLVDAGKSTRMNFAINIPADAAENEYYFALIASTRTETKTARIASLVYLHVDGGHARHTSSITDTSLFPFIIGSTIPYAFDVKNTGNVHAEVRSSVFLRGIAWYSADRDSHQIILPGQTRSIKGEVPAPILPGVYTLHYGYSEENIQKSTSRSLLVFYFPPWSIAGIIVIFLLVSWIYQRRQRA